jgi:hypothetical protein
MFSFFVCFCVANKSNKILEINTSDKVEFVLFAHRNFFLRYGKHREKLTIRKTLYFASFTSLSEQCPQPLLHALPGNRTQHLWGRSRLREPLHHLDQNLNQL